ncbi:putative enzyme related to lactoylglutathione lyase [Bacillus tianshenii]|uniref:Enzyme related to lactoylglutathione lyase n=1 Tax=Sutcliffiella tianshenii TaxID=1463404 RepID=A0ABS2NYE9_9BACI|nr:VOC family protein [Bacillus tianshenii]MBM7619706.1 putative enzyme related to lactoylglutathione lyase [Bacillus tianshenii]
MIKSPVKNKIKTIFIPVRDIEKAKEWYKAMLGIEDGEIQFGHLFIAEMEGTGMILDTMPKWRDENGELPTLNVPVIQFGTEDIHASYQFMNENGVNLVTKIEHGHFFVFRDLDGNMMMVCQD